MDELLHRTSLQLYGTPVGRTEADCADLGGSARRRHFKDPLLTRDGRGMKLTPFAESLLELVDQAVDSMQQVMGHRAVFDPGALRRTFTVVTSDYVTIVLLKPFLQSIMDEAPGVTINVVALGAHTQPALRRGECDLVVAPREVLPQDMAGYPHHMLFTDQFVIVADQDNTALNGGLSLQALRGLPFVDATPDLDLHDQGVNATRCISTGTTVLRCTWWPARRW